ncbi:hypothetical protein CapIbe_007490 [Capra ibex]
MWDGASLKWPFASVFLCFYETVRHNVHCNIMHTEVSRERRYLQPLCLIQNLVKSAIASNIFHNWKKKCLKKDPVSRVRCRTRKPFLTSCTSDWM